MKQIYSDYRLVFFIILTLSAFSNTTQAQTPVAILENASGDTVLSSFSDGGLLVPGEFGNGAIPAEGPGVRVMWYPAKAAFRAGAVSSDLWNEGKVGDYSTAWGRDTEASGPYSTALGRDTEASGDYSTALGNQTTAIGFSSTALGARTAASGDYSTAWGYNTATSGPYSTAWGYNTAASGFYSTAWGRDTEASVSYSTAWGYNTTASGSFSTAWGYNTAASGQYSTAWGLEAEASGDYSTALGNQTIARTPTSLSVGQYNASNTTNDLTLFVVGNGFSSMNLSDAFRVDASGNVYAAGSFNALSDHRLKENIHPLEAHTLDKLTKIHPVRYTFKNQQTHPTGTQIGLIAQEVQAQFPELVTTSSNGFLAVSYGHFAAVLLKGLQEQQIELEEKDRQIQELQAKVQRLEQFEARLARLEQLNHNALPTDAE